MRITEKEMELRRNRMIHVAYQLFNQHGIDGVSLATIAAEAGVSPKTVSRYFNSKAQLIAQTQAILWKEIVTCITAGTEHDRLSATSGLEELTISLVGFNTLYQQHCEYVVFYFDYQCYLFRNHIKLSPQHLTQILTEVSPIFLHALERGQRDGSISTEDTPTEQFLLIWGLLRYYIEHMAIYSVLCTGENPWESLFPKLMRKIVQLVKV